MKYLFIVFIFKISIIPEGSCDTISEFYKLYSATNNTNENVDLKGLSDLLVATSKISDWRIGGKGGPIEQNYLRFKVIKEEYDHLQKIDASYPLDTWGQTIVDIAKANPQDEKRTASLLSSAEPAIRWIGLKKYQELRPEQQSAHWEQLEKMANSDPFIFIGGQSSPSDHTDNSINLFIAPIREMAALILNIPPDNDRYRKLATDGIAELLHNARSRPEKKADISRALLELDPSVPEIKETQEKIKAGELLK